MLQTLAKGRKIRYTMLLGFSETQALNFESEWVQTICQCDGLPVLLDLLMTGKSGPTLVMAAGIVQELLSEPIAQVNAGPVLHSCQHPEKVRVAAANICAPGPIESCGCASHLIS